MFAEARQKATAAVVRVMRTACVVLGGALVFMALMAILTPLLLGMALLALASRGYNPAQTEAPQPMVITVG